MSRLAWLAATCIGAFAGRAGAASCEAAVATALPTGEPCSSEPALCQCLTQVLMSCRPTGQIQEAFYARGGCPAFGAPLTPLRPRLSTGGMFQEFERGEIAAYTDWPSDGGAATPDFVLSAYRRDQRIEVEWGSTGPYDYDFFILRWDLDDNPENVEKRHEKHIQQLDVEVPGDRGTASIDAAPEGTYVIYVEGCDDSGFLFLGGSDCDQGWSHPVYVDHLTTLAGPVPHPAQPPVTIPQGTLDLPDTVMLNDLQYRPIVEHLCRGHLIDPDGDHEGELSTGTALARLEAVKRNWPCADKTPGQLRDGVRAAIRDAVVKTQPGTDVSGLLRTIAGAGLGAAIGGIVGLLLGPGGAVIGAILGAVIGALTADPPGDYDMRLTGLLQIVHRFPAELDAGTREELIDELLTVRGGEDRRKDFVWVSGVPTPILETENHIWMTESARYLTNNLIALRFEQQGEPVPREYDNDANGMTDWILHELRRFLIDDFYELNSRPYAHHVVQPIQNLADFAAYNAGHCLQVGPPGLPPPSRRCDVRRAARNVLDFLAAKFALSSNELRRAAPFRRQPPFRNYPRLWTTGGDDMTWRYFAYTGGSGLLRDERHRRLMEGARGEALASVQSSYRPPVVVTDLIRSPATASFSPFQRFHSTRRDGNVVEIYYRHPRFLITAGGRHDGGAGAAALSSDEDAWALPTTLMPTAQGGDYRDFVRIEGDPDESERNNTCVAPGFACGLNPTLPAGLPAECARTDGNWTFINFADNTPQCPFGYGFYVAFYSEKCGAACDADSFGFFEATPYRSFDAYVVDVLSLNQSWDYRFDKVNMYASPIGGSITFALDSEDDQWPIVQYYAASVPVDVEREFRRWPVASGDVMNAPIEACIEVENRNLKQKLILDHTDVNKPRRTIIAAPGPRCACPLPDACISPRAE